MFSINNINIADSGYYINLDESTERKEHIESLKIKYEITDLNRFTALKDEFRQFSCTKSHLAVFEDALNKDLDSIFVCEDDMNISDFCYLPKNPEKSNFNDLLPNIIEDLNSVEWDVLLFGCNPKSVLIPVKDTLAIVDKSTGAWAYLIKKRAYKFLLENLNYRRDLLAIDDFLPLLNDFGFTTLTTIPMVMSHSVGFISTLQPNGPVNYTTWINGNYDRFLYDNYDKDFNIDRIEKYVTVVITGHFTENYLFYLNYLLYSLPKELLKCKFLINYDETGSDDINLERYKLNAYFRDNKSDLNISFNTSYGGLISSIKNTIHKVRTPYLLFLEHDWVFLNKDSIDFLSLIESFNKHNFINAVWFSKNDNVIRGSDITKDVEDEVTPFYLEERVKEVNLISTVRWSNNPAMFRLSKMKEWYELYIDNGNVGDTNQGQHNVEETMIPIYRKIISENKWDNIKDEWGTYLYGNIEEGPYVGHTDASKRYQGELKGVPEYNGEEYIKNNPI